MDAPHLLVPSALPPIVLGVAGAPRASQGGMLPRMRRLACALAALALPAFGVAITDTVHRARAPDAQQAVAPAPGGAAAAAARIRPLVRVAALDASEGARP
ncbi:hypothetical protein Q8W71_23740 [Methylobacterium sp. NEAU 140]|uniref:hypothetical protein n=1 Tax=Methylobacterium sp. NEAU 140 TaxID=3064945 RepID=UPI002734E9D9|nr:hypothetical protein [Methylobacterium sp. NEAU 140]MDP4025651.1 hypothetical protein [Methylobacterium sp. NEAU 140]